MRGREAIEAAIGAAALDRPPGTAAVYSDLGFILLGLMLERLGGARLDDQFEPIARACGPTLGFSPPAAWRERIAPTEFDPWRGRLLRGEVHDENAAVLEGVAGHAGLFGTAAEVGAFARLALATFRTPTIVGTPDTMRTFAARSSVPGSSRALGWDTMLPTSSCGTRMSASAIGHTGFTGPSLWIDVERDLYLVLLTNRVHPTRDNVRLRALRPRIHDAIVDAIEA
jgi:CubicO group peptidase (beta-lactamase class C family)